MKYTCECINGSLLFDWEGIKCGCANTGGILYQKFDGSNIDMKLIAEKRNAVLKEFSEGKTPKVCEQCYMLKEIKEDENTLNLDKTLDRIYLNHWFHCNAGCIYCCNRHITKGKITQNIQASEFYNLLPTIKKLCDEGYIGENTKIFPLGGEATILDEFDEIIELLNQYSKKGIIFLSSGIRYSQTIFDNLKKPDSELFISLDAVTPETYKKIKRVDCFDKVIENVKTYIRANKNNPRAVILKYILMTNLNDSISEIEKFINIAKSIGIKKLILDLDHSRQTNNLGKQIPEHYFQLFDYFQKTKDMECFITDQCKQILDKKYIF